MVAVGRWNRTLAVVLILTVGEPLCRADLLSGAASLFKKGTLYTEANGNRMVQYFGLEKECQVFGQAADVDQPRSKTLRVSTRTMSKLIDLCQEIHRKLFSSSLDWTTMDELSTSDEMERRNSHVAEGAFSHWSYNILDRVLIFPGTKWCGKGSVAENYFDLGVHRSADICCRDHDLCLSGESIEPGQCKRGLCNFSPVTRSSCSCDAEFANCLQSLQTKIGNTLGRIFFNYAGLTCYKFEHPIVRCQQYVDVTQSTRLPMWILQALQINSDPKRPRCRRYELDHNQPKRWQYFETVYDENSAKDEARMSRSPRTFHPAWNELESQEYSSLNFFNRMFHDFVLKIFESPNSLAS